MGVVTDITDAVTGTTVPADTTVATLIGVVISTGTKGVAAALTAVSLALQRDRTVARKISRDSSWPQCSTFALISGNPACFNC
jgi:hypothetical protein